MSNGLSKETIRKLADALVPEVIAYIHKDDRLFASYIGAVVCDSLGRRNRDGSCSINGGLNGELVREIAKRIRVTAEHIEGESSDIDDTM